jgi:hypothetical protein
MYYVFTTGRQVPRKDPNGRFLVLLNPLLEPFGISLGNSFKLLAFLKSIDNSYSFYFGSNLSFLQL